jgi:exopolysaccharide production protein ExoQ
MLSYRVTEPSRTTQNIFRRLTPKLILLVSLAAFWWLIKRDGDLRPGLSRSVWIPTFWVAIISSRPLSTWFGFGGGSDTLEGSPLDRLFFLLVIFAAFITLSRRRINLLQVAAENWPIFLFYGFLLISVLWANSPVSSFKRWFKEIGNILVLLVILTEINPQQAFRAVFVRCAYVLIPLSLVFVRWFPDLGRRYSIHSGAMEAIGVTFQKNSLGAMIFVCSLVIIWDCLEMQADFADAEKKSLRPDFAIRAIILVIGAYLLYLCDSKTSILCLVVGAAGLLTTRLPFLRQRLRSIGLMTLLAVAGLYVVDQLFGVRDAVVHNLGRDMTFTGRTDVWRELLNVGTDPVFGTGFMSFWDDKSYRSKLPDWVSSSAHNGYLEIYLAEGFVGVFFLVLMLCGVGLRINRALSSGGNFAVVRFAVLATTLIANFSESNFACMTPIGFLFLLTAVGHAGPAPIEQEVPEHSPASEALISPASQRGAPLQFGS